MMSPAFMIACVLHDSQHLTTTVAHNLVPFPTRATDVSHNKCQKDRNFPSGKKTKTKKKHGNDKMIAKLFPELGKLSGIVPTVLKIGISSAVANRYQQLPTVTNPPKFRNEYLQATSPQAPCCWK